MCSRMFGCGMSLNSLCLGMRLVFLKAFVSMVQMMTIETARAIHPDFTYLFNYDGIPHMQKYTYIISMDINLVSSNQLNKLCENSIPKALML